jgi:hypothetical protein
MYSPVYEILAIVGLTILLDVGLAFWVGKKLDQAARRAEEAGSERALDSSAKNKSRMA